MKSLARLLAGCIDELNGLTNFVSISLGIIYGWNPKRVFKLFWSYVVFCRYDQYYCLLFSPFFRCFLFNSIGLIHTMKKIRKCWNFYFRQKKIESSQNRMVILIISHDVLKASRLLSFVCKHAVCYSPSDEIATARALAALFVFVDTFLSFCI